MNTVSITDIQSLHAKRTTNNLHLLSKFDSAVSVLRNVTLQCPVPEGHIYLARMHISQATMSLLHLLEGPWLQG